jgi:hypothetical protein
MQSLCEPHAAMAHAELDAYRWDLDPEIGHWRTKIGTLWTVGPRARFELLDLLLEGEPAPPRRRVNPKDHPWSVGCCSLELT